MLSNRQWVQNAPTSHNKENVMRIGSSIFLIALGAILAWAVAPGLIPFVDQVLVGYILMAVGVIGLIASLILASPGRSRRISESRSVVDPNTGERITRNESRDGGL
jgi:polyferredoxin